jgi:hypothetical protein
MVAGLANQMFPTTKADFENNFPCVWPHRQGVEHARWLSWNGNFGQKRLE